MVLESACFSYQLRMRASIMIPPFENKNKALPDTFATVPAVALSSMPECNVVTATVCAYWIIKKRGKLLGQSCTATSREDRTGQ